MWCRFSDNNFILLPWAPKTITFTSAAPFSPADLRGSLSVMSVADTYPPAIAVLQPPPVDTYYPNTLNWIQVSPQPPVILLSIVQSGFFASIVPARAVTFKRCAASSIGLLHANFVI